MILSELMAKYKAETGKDFGFMVQSKATGNQFEVVGQSPTGRFLMIKKSGNGAGKDVLVDDTDRYLLVDGKAAKRKARIAEIRAALGGIENKRVALEDEALALEHELESLEEVG